jgi:hypothetical protein
LNGPYFEYFSNVFEVVQIILQAALWTGGERAFAHVIQRHLSAKSSGGLITIDDGFFERMNHPDRRSSKSKIINSFNNMQPSSKQASRP